MKYEAIPLLKLTVENMKHQIISHLGIHGSELGKALDKEISRAVELFPWEEKVTEIVFDALNNHIENFFRYGKGSIAIQEAVEEGFKESLNKIKRRTK